MTAMRVIPAAGPEHRTQMEPVSKRKEWWT